MSVSEYFLRHNHKRKMSPEDFDKIIGSKENTNAFIEKKLERLVYEDMQEPSFKDFKVKPGRKYVTKSPVDHSLALSPNPHRLPRIDDGIDLDYELKKANNGGINFSYKPLTLASQEIIKSKNQFYDNNRFATESNVKNTSKYNENNSIVDKQNRYSDRILTNSRSIDDLELINSNKDLQRYKSNYND